MPLFKLQPCPKHVWGIAAVCFPLFLLLMACTGEHTDDTTQSKPPNILLILADDLGIEGIGAYGGELFETPNIDRLAHEGMMFTRAFANPYCTPSRSELLTGRYPFATRTPSVIWDYEMHGDQVLDPSEPSFARQLQHAGYATAIAGKWQLSFLAHQDWVRQLGFDTYMLWQIVSDQGERTTRYYRPYYRKDGRVIADEIKDSYGPDVLVDYLIDFMKENHERGQPFMAYYTALLPHFPWLPTPDSDDQTMPDRPDTGIFHGDPKFFPDMVEYLDKNTGRLLDALDELGVAENTVVIFLADNGTDPRLSARIHGQEVHGGKSTLTDRGTLVPLVIRWPGHIQPGSTDEELVELADFLPTFCEIAGAPLPEEPIHGKSFAGRLFHLVPEAELKPWVHIQMAGDRYLRDKEWVVTDQGVYKKVQPYPVDATEALRQHLGEAELQKLQQLERELIELVE